MSNFEDVVHEFIQTLGMQQVPHPLQAPVQLRLASGDLMGMQPTGAGNAQVLVHYARLCALPPAPLLLKAFQHCAALTASDAALQVALHENAQGRWLVASQRLPLAGLAARHVHQTLQQLRQFWEEMER